MSVVAASPGAEELDGCGSSHDGHCIRHRNGLGVDNGDALAKALDVNETNERKTTLSITFVLAVSSFRERFLENDNLSGPCLSMLRRFSINIEFRNHNPQMTDRPDPETT